MRKIPFAGIELTSQRVRGLRGTSELPGRPADVEVVIVRKCAFPHFSILVNHIVSTCRNKKTLAGGTVASNHSDQHEGCPDEYRVITNGYFVPSPQPQPQSQSQSQSWGGVNTLFSSGNHPGWCPVCCI